MPALTNSRLGSSKINEALGTSIWPDFSKWRRKRRRISAVCMKELPVARPGALMRAGRGQLDGGGGHGGGR